MATGRNQRDVALVIKARDEATKTFDAVVDALQHLVESQSDLASGSAGAQNRLSQFTNILLSLDKAASDVSSKFDTAAESLSRMQQRAAGNATRYDNLTREAEGLTRVVQLLSAEADKAFIGPRRNGLTETLRSAKSDLTTLNREIASLGSSISRDLEGIGGAASPLQQLASTERAVAEASQFARAQIEQQTRALHDMERQAKTLTPLQSRINAVTGISRPDASGSAAAAAEVLALADAQYRVAEARNADIQKLKQQEAATASLAREQEAQQKASAFLVSSGSGKSARESAAVFAEAEATALRQAENAHKAFEDRVKQGSAALREEDAAIARLRGELDPLASITARAATEQAKLDDWLKRGKIDAIEHANATKLLAASTKDAVNAQKSAAVNTPRVSLFGLRPYETQNLLYQFNDIVTQLGSGTSLSQTLAQQGGQIFQLFQNRIGPSIAAAFSNPYFLAAGAVLGVFIVGLREANSELGRMRQFNADIAASADGGFYDTRKLEEATQALDSYGMTAEEALNSVRTLMKNNVAENQFVTVGEAAKNLAVVVGGDLDDAVKKVAESFTKGFDAIDKLDQSMNFLTATEREHIRSLFEEGRAGQARTEALRIFSERMNTAANDMRGSWSDAVRSLSGAWSDFKQLIGDSSFIEDMTRGLSGLGMEISILINKMRGIRNAGTIMLDIQHHELAIKDLSENLGWDPFGVGARNLANLKKELADLRAELERVQKADGTRSANGDTVNRNSEAQRKVDQDIHNRSQKELADAKLLTREARIKAAVDAAALDASNAGASAAGIAEAKRTAEARERAKIEKEIEQERRQAAEEAKRNSTVQMQSVRLLKGFEGYKPKAYWDVNAFRVGYGSDTTTGIDGSVRRVKPGTTTDRESAERDLLRRIDEFIKTVKGQIGADRFASFGAEQQSALVSIAYNYGKLPDRILGAVRTGTNEQIAQAVRGLKGDNGGVNSRRREKEAAILGRENPAVEQNSAKILEDNKKKQDDFNLSVEKANQDRQESIDALTAENGLMGEQLIAAQRTAAINKAESDLRQRNVDANKNLKPGEAEIVLTDEQIKKTRDLTAALFDLSHAKDVAAARRAKVDDPVADFTAQRDAIQQQIEFSQRNGDNSALAGLEERLTIINGKLKEATDAQLGFYQSILDGGPSVLAQYGLTANAVQSIIDKNLALAASQPNLQTQFLQTGKQINETFASGGANALDQFSQKVAAGAKVMKSLGQAFLQFAADFLRQIAQMIIKQAIFNAIGGATGSGSGGVGGSIFGAIGGLFKHDGGRLGGGRSRPINPAIFAGAMRLHSGGVPGLRQNEVPAILERDEEVLTRSDPRHILNGGKNGRAPVVVPAPEVKVVNAIDAGDALSKGMDTRVGQQAFLNFISANPEAVKQAMGG